jgi:hypothetical protein
MAEGVKAKKGTKKTGRRENERRERKKIIRISFSRPRTPVYIKIAAGSLRL